MKVSLEWLKEFVPIRLPVEKLCERLAMGGLEVVRVEKKDGDTILEIEVTPNRPDLLSHIGIAREIAALTRARPKFPKIPYTVPRKPYAAKLPLRISVQDKKGCLRYIGRLFDNVQVGPTPSWMKERLERLGLRSVNNVVDTTNYVLLETGQPLHAFDYDKIEGGDIIIRSARRGETLATLDGESRTLQEVDLVIADSKKPIALAGVIGGKETEIGPDTKRVLLESAYFDPVRIRRTSKRLGVSTESSYRFERSVSLEGVKQGSDRVALFLMKWADASLVASLDHGQKSFPSKRIQISLQGLEEILGVSLSSSRTRALLSSLDCRVSTKGRSFQVTPPLFRRDLKEMVDVAEEVGRLLGYDQIPVTVPIRERVSLEKEIDPAGDVRRIEKQIKDFLVSQGLFEVVTYSLLSKTLLKTAMFGPEGGGLTKNRFHELLDEVEYGIRIKNPVSLEQEVMRPSLIPRLKEVAAYNHHRQVEGVAIFEIGPVYQKNKNAYTERKQIGILLSGVKSGDWNTKPSPYNYFDIKGTCEALVKMLNPFAEIHYRPIVDRAPGYPANWLLVGNQTLGSLRGAEKTCVAELDLEALVSVAAGVKKYAPLPKYPFVHRDISLIVKENFASEEIMQIIRTEGGSWVQEVSLFDTYSDPRIVPEGCRGLAYRIEFLHPDRTLTDEEVNEKYKSILEALKKHSAQVR